MMQFCLTNRNKSAVNTPLCGIFHRTTGTFDAVDRKCMIEGLNSVVKGKFSQKVVNVVERVSTSLTVHV